MKIFGPYEMGGKTATLAFEYQPGAKVPYILTQHIEPARPGDTIDTYLFIDGLKRVLQTKKDATIQSAAVFNTTQDGTKPTKTRYDVMDCTEQCHTACKPTIFVEI